MPTYLNSHQAWIYKITVALYFREPIEKVCQDISKKYVKIYKLSNNKGKTKKQTEGGPL